MGPLGDIRGYGAKASSQRGRTFNCERGHHCRAGKLSLHITGQTFVGGICTYIDKIICYGTTMQKDTHHVIVPLSLYRSRPSSRWVLARILHTRLRAYAPTLAEVTMYTPHPGIETTKRLKYFPLIRDTLPIETASEKTCTATIAIYLYV